MPAFNRSPAGALDRLHGRVRTSELLFRFALANRILLAVGFIPTGMVKLLGQRFTRMDPATPVGMFFETLYQSGPYWRFIGASQVIAGILLLVPRTATLGAVMFLPIMLNIFVVTVSFGFKGTPVVTAMMLLATLFLLCWDYDRLRAVLFDGPYAPEPEHARRRVRALSGAWERGVYAAGTAAALGFFAAMRGLVPSAAVPVCLAVGAVAALLAAAVLLLRLRPTTAALRPTA